MIVSASACSDVFGRSFEIAQRRQFCRRLFVFGFVMAAHARGAQGMTGARYVKVCIKATASSITTGKWMKNCIEV